MPPQVDVFTTSILSSAALRSRHERVLRALQALRIPFTTHDVAGSEDAKAFWRRKARGNNELPCLLVDGETVGSIEQFDEAVEFGELRQFLRLDEPSAPTSVPTATTPVPQATLDDFSDLSLTPSELAELTAELSASQRGYVPRTQAAQDHSFTFVPTAPLNFGGSKSVTGSGKDRVEVLRAGGDRPLADGGRKDLLEGIDLTDEEARALAKELGLDDDEEGLVTGSASGTTTVEGMGGAELSAPLEKVEELRLDPETVATLREEVAQSGDKLEIQPVSSFEKKVVEEAKHPRAALEEPEVTAAGSSKAEVGKLKSALSGGKGRREELQVPVTLEVEKNVDGRVVSAIQDGLL